VAKLAAIAVGAFAALQVLPALLRPPQPPPLEADVGLPRVGATREPVRGGEPAPRPEASPPKPRFATDGERPKRIAKRPIRKRATESRFHRDASRSKGTAQSSPAPLPAAAAAPPPVTSAAPPPVQPAPTGDGSEEFAPH
jgi:hypothetical protein